ncbi:MAG: metal ABC transporter substrate-binding protein [Lachnospiraceae bacterium]|nr:metal ABC transporter substrate-binding protein [Lachnospiraceae bacterium]
MQRNKKKQKKASVPSGSRLRRALSRLGACLALLCLCAGLLTGCKSREDDSFQAVCTIYPIYDWMQTLLEGVEGVELTLLADSGADMHSYQASADDIIAIRESELFVGIGGESEQWVLDVLESGAAGDRTDLLLLPLLGDRAKQEELVEGMEPEGSEEHEEHDHEEAALDEHVWLSIRNAEFFVETLSSELQRLLPEQSGTIAENAEAYRTKLSALDEKYGALCEAAPRDTLVIGDRFPFRYLVDDYGLKYYAAFAGCSAESEASFDTVVFLAEKLDELKLPTLLVLDGSDRKLAETIVQNTKSRDQRILVLNSMQSVTPKEGVSYLSLMEENYRVLAEALGAEP